MIDASFFEDEKNNLLVESKNYVSELSTRVSTMHHHYHILWPILEHLKGESYLEIGCFCGSSLLTALKCKTLKSAIAVDTFEVIENQRALVEKNVFDNAENKTCSVSYVSGSSHDISAIARVYEIALQNEDFYGFNAIFIDGDHSSNGVLDDFKFFRPLLANSGVIVFDDYADSYSSPEVYPAVNSIALINPYGDQIIGQPKNWACAFGNGLENTLSNEFLLQSQPKKIFSDAKYIVCISSYERRNGKTPSKLKAQLNAILNQTFSDWFVIVIGDHYENEAEFYELSEILPKEKCYFENLPVACERENPSIPRGEQLWRCAGCAAVNYGLLLAQNLDGVRVYVHSDDDDLWDIDHLETIHNIYEKYEDAAFVSTIGRHLSESILIPRTVAILQSENESICQETFPKCGETLHSSTSWRLDRIKLRYRINPNLPTDGDMWEQIAAFLSSSIFKSYCAKKATVWHLEENAN